MIILEKNIRIIKKYLSLLYYFNLIIKYKINKKTWHVMKEDLRKVTSNHQNFSKIISVNRISVTQSNSITENINKYFTEIVPNLIKSIKKSGKNFAQYSRKYGSGLLKHSVNYP